MVTSSVSCFGFRISDGTVFTKNGGFRLFLGQPNEFPIMQVTYHMQFLGGKTIVQARHIPVSPGKEHTVELSGTHISTATNPDLWKLEGECEKKTICGTHFLSMKKIKMWNTFSFNPCRFDANEKSEARQTWM